MERFGPFFARYSVVIFREEKKTGQMELMLPPWITIAKTSEKRQTRTHTILVHAETHGTHSKITHFHVGLMCGNVIQSM